MTIDLFVLILWTISGILTIIQGLSDDNYKIPLGSYLICWLMLIVYLIERVS